MSIDIPLVLRPSSIIKYETCGYSYYLSDVLKIREGVRPASLPLGTSVDVAIKAFLLADLNGTECDIRAEFMSEWTRQLNSSVLKFTYLDESESERVGLSLVSLFPEFWRESGLQLVKDRDGKPLVGVRLKVNLGDNVYLSGEPDLIASCKIYGERSFGVVDVKVPRQVSSHDFVLSSDQLTAYQALIVTHAERLGLSHSKLEFLQFIEGQKLKTKSGWSSSNMAPPREPDVVSDYLRKVKVYAGLIRSGFFPKVSRHAFNNPCMTCTFAGLCLRKTGEGLTSKRQDVMDMLSAGAVPAALAKPR